MFILTQAGILSWVMNNNNKMTDQAINQDFSSSIQISRMAIEGNKLRRYEKEFFIYIGKTEKMLKYEDEWQNSYDTLESMLHQILSGRSGHWSDEELQDAEIWLTSLKGYGVGFHKVVNAIKNGQITDTITANTAIHNAKQRFKKLLRGTESGGAIRYKRANAVTQEIESSHQMLTRILIVTTLAGIFIVLLMLFKIPALITNSIQILSESAEKMSKGDLDQVVPIDETKAEFLSLAKTLERMRLSQKTLIYQIRSKKDA
jgi:methyl-accepting chemotaxis protein